MTPKIHFSIPLACICVVLHLLSVDGPADEFENDLETEDSAYQLAPIVVRTTRIREARDDPSSFATVIQPEQFSSQFRTAEDLLSRVPGVNVKRFGGLGQFSTVSIRGSSAEQVLVMLDGVRLNTGEGGSVDFSTVPLESIERIEIIRGGGTAVYGADAIGGVVNLITKKPSETPEVSVGFSYGSQDTIKAVVTGNGRSRNIRYLFSGTHFQSDGDFDYRTPRVQVQGQTILEGKDRTRINNDFSSENVLAKGDVSLSETLRLTVSNDLFYTERGQPGTVFDVREKARQEVLRNLSNARLEKEGFLVQNLRLSAGTFFRYNRVGFHDPTPALGNLPIRTESHESAWGIQTGAGGFWKVFNAGHGVDWRGEFGRDLLDDEVMQGQVGYGERSRSYYEWHLQYEIIVLEEKLSLTPAVSYEESTDYGGHWTGKIGVVGKPLTWLTLKANYQNAFRKPNFNELYFPDQGFIRGNPDLRSEKSRNFDAGLELNFRRLFAQVSYYRNWIDESILWLPISFYTIAPVNTGAVDAWGVEVDSEWRPWGPLYLTGNYTFLSARSQETGQQLNGRPRHTVNFKVYLHDSRGEMYAEVQYLSKIPVRYTSTSAIAVNARAVLDLGITANLASVPCLKRVAWLRKLTLGLEGKNVNDASVYDALNYPLPGRMLFVTVRAVLW